MGTEKFRSSSLWDSSRSWITKITATSSEPMGGSDSKREEQFLSRIGHEKPTIQRESHEKLPRNSRNTKNLMRRNRSSKTSRNRWIVSAAHEGSFHSEPIIDSNSGFYRVDWIPCQMQENFTILKRRAALEHPTFPVNPWQFRVPEECLAAILDCRMIHGILSVLQETFFESPRARIKTTLSSLRKCLEFGIIFLWNATEHNTR